MRAGAAVRRLRPVLAAALLALPLFAGLTGGATAQTAVECNTANSDGSYSVPSDWALKPSGLNDGDRFRLLFATSLNRNATATGIATYNTFVQTRAKAGHSAITDSCGNFFKVVGSTATVDARDNTGTTGAGVPIYWLNGNKLANNYADFYDGSWGSLDFHTETGTAATSSSVWTGSNQDGTKHSTDFLGSSSNVRWGLPVSGSNPISQESGAANVPRFLYALSPVFQVGTPTPTGSLTFAPTSVTVVEGEDATYTVRLGTAPTGTVTVTPSSDNADVTFAPASLTFTTGNWNSPKTVTVSAAMDVDGTDDTATLSHTASGGGYGSVTGNVGVMVTDNDVPRLLFSTTSLLVTEGGSTTYRVRLGMMPSGTVTVTPSRTGSSDVTFAPASLTFTTGNWNSPQMVTVSAGEDSDQNNDEATLSHGASGGGYHAVTGNVEVAVTVNDNDVLPPCTNCVWITGGSDITEGGDANFTVHANPAPSADMTVRLVVFDARGLSDFLNGGDSFSKQVTIRRGTTAAMYTATTQDDSTHEADGDVRVRISSGRAGGRTYFRHDPYTASVTVRDDDTALPAHVPPNISISTLYGALSGSREVTEGTRGYFCVTIDGPNPGGTSLSDRLGAFPSHHPGIFRVAVQITDSSGQIVPRWGSNSMQFHRDHWNKDEATRANCFYFDTDGAEGETYTARVIRGGRVYSQGRIIQLYETGHMTSASITVVRPMSSPPVVPPDGQLSTVTISADRTSVTEGGDATFTVSANPAPAFDLVVHVSADEEMGSGDDRTGGGHLGTVTIRAWQTSATWTLTTISDEVARADGTVTARIQSGYDYTVGDPSSVTVALLDDDGVTTQSVTDPATPGVDTALVAEVTALADGHSNPAAAARLRRVVKGMTGEDGGYTAEECRETATRHGVLSTWKPWCDEIARREAHTPPVPQQQQVVTLPAVSVSAGADVTEGGDAVFTVTASPAPASPLAVSVTVAATGDFGITAGSQPVTIPTTGSATLTLATSDDDADEPDGSVSVTVAAGEGYTVGDPASGSVSIADNDEPVPDSVVGDNANPGVDPALVAQVRDYLAKTDPVARPHVVERWQRVLAAFGDDNGHTPMTAAEAQAFADQGYDKWVPVAAALEALEAAQQPLTLPAVTVSAGADVTEGGDAVFTVTASPAPASALSVTVTVATAGEFGVTAGSRTVPIPTTGSATLTLATANDEVDEADGSVSVRVAAGNGYTVGDPASGSVSIADDDLPLPAITVSAGDAVTEGGDATFTVTASPAPVSPLSVSVTVAAEGDYGIASGTRTVSIPTAGSATLTLATTNDDADEPDGSVSVTVAAGNGYTVGDPASGSVSIADDDLPPPVVSIAAKAASVTEGGAAAFTLTADRAPDADLTVTLSVAETGGGDHVAAADEGPATAVIAKGATEAIFSVATVDDDVDEPDGSVTVTLKDGGGYTVPSPPGNAAVVTVSDNDAAALPSLSVADVTVKEGAWMEFTVRLSAPSAGGVSVKVSTRDSTPVSATRRDYWPISGRTVSFRAGETERSVGVIVYDDNHDEEAETFEFVLSDARGAAIGDGVAVGTITNDDPMPAAWLARFGRTVAEQALDGIAGRMSADRTPGMRGSIAGQALSFDPAANDNPGSRGAGPGHAPDGAAVPGGTGALALADVAQAFGGQSGQSGPGGFGHDAAGFGSGFDGMQPQSQTMTARDALLGSSFSLTGATDGSGGSMAFWGRAAQGGFDGREGTFSLDGTVTTGMLGADYARGKWLVGLALAQSEGEGDYRDSDVSPRPDGQSCPDGVDSGLCSGAVRAGDGSVEASLTAAIPYAALQASERLKLWGAAGYGTGEVTLKTALGGSYKADTSWSMAAAGLRGELLAPPAEGSGPALAVTSDALWTRSSSEKTRDLAASESDATRLRLGLEGSYRMALESGGHLTPKLEIGARHDGGDAETGFGVELGGGVAWSAPALGLSLDVSGRTLIAHGNDDLKDRGYAAALAFDPDPATQRGPSLSLRQEFGGQAQGGARRAVRAQPAGGPHGQRGDFPLEHGGGVRLARLWRALDRQPACGSGARHGCARLQPRLAADAGGRERARPVVRPPCDPQGERHGPGGAHGRGQYYRALVSHGARR